jgi:hypothetical protein
MIKKVLSVLIVFALIFSFSACKEDTDTTTAVDGSITNVDQTDDTSNNVTEIVTDENGESVTDENGATVVVGTTEAESLISDEALPTGETVEVTTSAEGNPTNSLLDSALGNIFEGDKYSIKFTAQIDMDGARQTLPAAIYISDDKSLVELTMGDSGLGLGLGLGEMGILDNGTDQYFLMSIMGLLKGYVTIPAEQSGDYDDMFDFSSFSDTTDMKYIETTQVTYNGVDYICEEYRSTDTTTKFYFNSGELKRIEQVSDDGTSAFMENIDISTSFSESVFDIPNGYKEITEKDLENLGNLGGLFG